MNQPLVAIVTPVYNGSPFLEEAIRSVQTQTYPNLVHVILDNASTDSTPEVIESFKNHRVPIISKRNSKTIPLHSNWEASIKLIPKEADYFRVLCADDIMTPDAVERLVAVASSDPKIDVVGSLYGEGGTPAAPQRISAQGLPDQRSVFNGLWVLKSYFMHIHSSISPTHALIKTTRLTDRPDFYDKQFLSFDLEVYLRILLDSNYGFVHSPIGWTRLHAHSVSSTVKNDQIFALEWLSYLERFGARSMNEAELKICRRATLRHHYRRMLLWRYYQGDSAKYDRHLKFLNTLSIKPRFGDYAEALLEWIWLALRRRRDEIGATRSLWSHTMAELKD